VGEGRNNDDDAVLEDVYCKSGIKLTRLDTRGMVLINFGSYGLLKLLRVHASDGYAFYDIYFSFNLYTLLRDSKMGKSHKTVSGFG
jgi:hypothetical protein